MTNNPLKYTNCWEDAELLAHALKIEPSSSIMSIASAGDNSLFLLCFNPKELICVDLNEHQLFLTQLKEKAIKHLDYESFLKFLGFKPSLDREKYFRQISEELTLQTRNYWIKHLDLIKKGIIHEGKFEHYFHLFSHKILPFIHSKKRIKSLFENKTSAQQKDFYSKKWNTLRWKLLFKLFFSRFIMGRFGREPEKLKYVEANVGKAIFNLAEQHLSSVFCQKNHFLYYQLNGNFGEYLPPYAKEDNFLKIQDYLKSNSITYEFNSLENALEKHKNCNRFNLSNIFEYLDENTFLEIINLLNINSKEDTRLAYWNLLVKRAINDPKWNQININTPDLGFFYQKFYLYTKL